MAIPNPNPNIADGVKCDNKTYSSNKIESLISSTKLPIPEAGDAGKVLTVNAAEDGYELEAPLAIDDSAASATSVYSSSKVDTLLNGKQDTSTALKCVIIQGTLTSSVSVAANSQVAVFDNVDIKNGNVFSSMAIGTLADIPDHILGAILIWTNTGAVSQMAFLPHSGSTISLSVINLYSDAQTITGTRLMLFGY